MPDEPDDLESEYLACLRDTSHESTSCDPGRQAGEVVVSDELGRSYHVCSINGRAKVVCAGDNRHAQLGLGNTWRRTSLREVELPAPARAVGVAGNHSCAALEDRVMCWGTPDVRGHESHRFAFEATEVWVDDSLSCARKFDGTIWCWGSPDEEIPLEDEFGGIEAGARPRRVNVPWPADTVGSSWVLGKQVLRHVPLDGNLAARNDDVVWQTSGVRAAEASPVAVCVHWTTGRFRCVDAEWGDFYPGIDQITDFAVDRDGVCVVRRGKVQCATEVGGWTEVKGVDAALRVAGGCALEKSGTVTCWSVADAMSYAIEAVWPTRAHDVVDIAGSLATGMFVLTKQGSLERIHHGGDLEVLIERGVVQFDAGWGHACARIDDDGDGRSESIECIGSNDAGQLGKPSDALILAPTVVTFAPS